METDFKCSRCQKRFPRGLVMKHNVHRGIQYYYCRPCNTARSVVYRSTERGRNAVRKANYAYMKRFSGKQGARVKLNAALKKGEVVKGLCKTCGEKKVFAHHLDYRKPLLVEWYCRTHHADVHRMV